MRRDKPNNPAASIPAASRAESPDSVYAYEHFGRIDILESGLTGSPFVNVNLLANLAQQQLDSGHPANAAYLLRAAEHLSFAALAPKDSARLTADISPELRAAVAAEHQRLTRTAEEYWAESGKTFNRVVIETIYASVLKESREAFDRGAYRSALHLARAAEELGYLTEGLPATLPGDRQFTHRLAS
jgi:hypothetical protein